jgi:hypothetical protein
MIFKKMKRFDIINKLIKKYGYISYLEIGVRHGNNIKKIKCNNKIGVDIVPNKYVNYQMTSDEFFDQNDKSFDIIFIDGLHTSSQVYRDINNSLKVLNPNGTIVCHDMNPTTKLMQQLPRSTSEWTGNCWKAWISLRQTRPDLFMMVVNTDYGCGVIQKGEQKLLEISEEITYENFEKNRFEWLNLKSIDEFNKIFQ